ncbi:hypothetical protein QC760_008508 [Botrytis cinerea]
MICVQSEFFMNMVDRDWKEGAICEILLSSDEAGLNIVQKIVRFLFYHRSFDDEHGFRHSYQTSHRGDGCSIHFRRKSAASRVEVLLDRCSRHAYSPTDAAFETLKFACAYLPQWDIDLKLVILCHVLNHESLEPLMNEYDFGAFLYRIEA